MNLTLRLRLVINSLIMVGGRQLVVASSSLLLISCTKRRHSDMVFVTSLGLGLIYFVSV